MDYGKRTIEGKRTAGAFWLTGVGGKVKYGIELTEEAREHGGGWGAARGELWTRCSVRASHHHPIPDGSYFLPRRRRSRAPDWGGGGGGGGGLVGHLAIGVEKLNYRIAFGIDPQHQPITASVVLYA